MDGWAVKWRKSTRSGTNGCVEVAVVDDHVMVRDSKNPDRATLEFTAPEWRAFLLGAQAGEFDLP